MKCAVVIPVGPGHEDKARQAVQSVKQAIAFSKGIFDEIVVWTIDDTQAKLGRSKARNLAIKKAQDIDWLFFLDADDLMLQECFKNAADHLHFCDALWGSIVVRELNSKDNILRLPQVLSINSINELLAYHPALTLQMGHFVKSDVALNNCFNETIDVGEDFDYYLRVWDENNCRKINKPFFVNRRGMHSQGARCADGLDWLNAVIPKIAKYRELCSLNENSFGQVVQEKQRELDGFCAQNGIDAKLKLKILT